MVVVVKAMPSSGSMHATPNVNGAVPFRAPVPTAFLPIVIALDASAVLDEDLGCVVVNCRRGDALEDFIAALDALAIEAAMGPPPHAPPAVRLLRRSELLIEAAIAVDSTLRDALIDCSRAAALAAAEAAAAAEAPPPPTKGGKPATVASPAPKKGVTAALPRLESAESVEPPPPPPPPYDVAASALATNPDAMRLALHTIVAKDYGKWKVASISHAEGAVAQFITNTEATSAALAAAALAEAAGAEAASAQVAAAAAVAAAPPQAAGKKVAPTTPAKAAAAAAVTPATAAVVSAAAKGGAKVVVGVPLAPVIPPPPSAKELAAAAALAAALDTLKAAAPTLAAQISRALSDVSGGGAVGAMSTPTHVYVLIDSPRDAIEVAALAVEGVVFPKYEKSVKLNNSISETSLEMSEAGGRDGGEGSRAVALGWGREFGTNGVSVFLSAILSLETPTLLDLLPPPPPPLEFESQIAAAVVVPVAVAVLVPTKGGAKGAAAPAPPGAASPIPQSTSPIPTRNRQRMATRAPQLPLGITQSSLVTTLLHSLHSRWGGVFSFPGTVSSSDVVAEVVVPQVSLLSPPAKATTKATNEPPAAAAAADAVSDYPPASYAPSRPAAALRILLNRFLSTGAMSVPANSLAITGGGTFLVRPDAPAVDYATIRDLADVSIPFMATTAGEGDSVSRTPAAALHLNGTLIASAEGLTALLFDAAARVTTARWRLHDALSRAPVFFVPGAARHCVDVRSLARGPPGAAAPSPRAASLYASILAPLPFAAIGVPTVVFAMVEAVAGAWAESDLLPPWDMDALVFTAKAPALSPLAGALARLASPRAPYGASSNLGGSAGVALSLGGLVAEAAAAAGAAKAAAEGGDVTAAAQSALTSWGEEVESSLSSGQPLGLPAPSPEPLRALCARYKAHVVDALDWFRESVGRAHALPVDDSSIVRAVRVAAAAGLVGAPTATPASALGSPDVFYGGDGAHAGAARGLEVGHCGIWEIIAREGGGLCSRPRPSTLPLILADRLALSSLRPHAPWATLFAPQGASAGGGVAAVAAKAIATSTGLTPEAVSAFARARLLNASLGAADAAAARACAHLLEGGRVQAPHEARECLPWDTSVWRWTSEVGGGGGSWWSPPRVRRLGRDGTRNRTLRRCMRARTRHPCARCRAAFTLTNFCEKSRCRPGHSFCCPTFDIRPRRWFNAACFPRARAPSACGSLPAARRRCVFAGPCGAPAESAIVFKLSRKKLSQKAEKCPSMARYKHTARSEKNGYRSSRAQRDPLPQ